MKKKLFLTGPAGCGKSMLITSILGHRMQSAGGFVTRKDFDDKGKLLSDMLLPAAAVAGVEGLEGEVFLDYKASPPKSDSEVFRKLGTQLVQEAMYYPFAVLDSFGGTDLLIPEYRAALQELLNSDVPCIGAIKSPEEIKELKKDFHLTDRFIMLTDNLAKVLSADSDTLILPTNGKGDMRAVRIIQQWAGEFA